MGERRNNFAEGESWQTGSALKAANMELFIDWLLIPKGVRDPATRGEFADQLGVTTQTLRNYERDTVVINGLANRRREIFKTVDLPNVISGLVLRAGDPSGMAPAPANAAAKILLEWAEKQTVEMNADAVRDMSDEDVKRMAIQIFEKFDN